MSPSEKHETAFPGPAETPEKASDSGGADVDSIEFLLAPPAPQGESEIISFLIQETSPSTQEQGAEHGNVRAPGAEHGNVRAQSAEPGSPDKLSVTPGQVLLAPRNGTVTVGGTPAEETGVGGINATTQDPSGGTGVDPIGFPLKPQVAVGFGPNVHGHVSRTGGGTAAER